MGWTGSAAPPVLLLSNAACAAVASDDTGAIDSSGIAQISTALAPEADLRVFIDWSGSCIRKWRRDGKELFYISADCHITAAPITLGADVRTVPVVRQSRCSPRGS